MQYIVDISLSFAITIIFVVNSWTNEKRSDGSAKQNHAVHKR
jgi:hypothetical protein